MKLYFIAILPDSGLRERIKDLKLEVKEKYGVKHALKLPAHITLHIPFKFAEEQESLLFEQLESFAAKQKPFEVNLNGFGSFPPRVLFIKVEQKEPLKKLYDELQQLVSGLLESDDLPKNASFHPHITIATRDLDKEIYNEAWPKFKERNFKAAFSVERLTLFRHTGKIWQLGEEFPFSGF